jgi:hypothetical protein
LLIVPYKISIQQHHGKFVGVCAGSREVQGAVIENGVERGVRIGSMKRSDYAARESLTRSTAIMGPAAQRK